MRRLRSTRRQCRTVTVGAGRGEWTVRDAWLDARRRGGIERRRGRAPPCTGSARANSSLAASKLLAMRCEGANTPGLMSTTSLVPLTAREREIGTLAAAGVAVARSRHVSSCRSGLSTTICRTSTASSASAAGVSSRRDFTGRPSVRPRHHRLRREPIGSRHASLSAGVHPSSRTAASAPSKAAPAVRNISGCTPRSWWRLPARRPWRRTRHGDGSWTR